MQSLNKTLQELMRGQNIANNIQQTMKQVYADKDVQAFLNENRDRLSKEAIKRGQSKLYEFFHEKQLIEKGVPTVAPGYSPQLVISAGQIDVTYVPTKQLLERQRQRYIQRLVNSINMPKFIKNASYDDYYLNEDTQTDTRTKAIQAAMDFTDNYQKDNFQPGLYLYGKFGVGKTYLLGAIANELAKSKGVATTMVHFPSFAVEMRNSIKQNNTGEKLDAIKRAPILMLDDVGAGAMTTWVRDDILGVILNIGCKKNYQLSLVLIFQWMSCKITTLLSMRKAIMSPSKRLALWKESSTYHVRLKWKEKICVIRDKVLDIKL